MAGSRNSPNRIHEMLAKIESEEAEVEQGGSEENAWLLNEMKGPAVRRVRISQAVRFAVLGVCFVVCRIWRYTFSRSCRKSSFPQKRVRGTVYYTTRNYH